MTAELKARQTAAELARTRVQADIDDLLVALAPASLVREGIDAGRAKAAELAGDAKDFVKDRPLGTGAVIGGAAAVGIWKLVATWRARKR